MTDIAPRALIEDDSRYGRDGAAVTAASKRRAISAKAGVGPRHRRSSTLSKSFTSVRSVASVAEQQRSVALARQRARERGRVAAFTPHVAPVVGNRLEVPNFASTAAADFAPQPGSPG